MTATATRARRDARPPKDPVPKQTRVTHRIETITPEIARGWLEKNESNRNLDQRIVDRYARDMKAGRWHMTGDPIQFGISGRLLNGQHRLWACFDADTAFESMVVRGLINEEEIVDVIDTGKKRTLGSALQIHGEKDAVLLASIVNTCWRYEEHRLKAPVYPTHEEGLQWLRDHPEVRDSVAVARRANQMLKAHPSAAGTAYYLSAATDPEAAHEFWDGAVTGEDLPAGSAILAYRRWAIGANAKREKPSPSTWLAYNLKAMQQWRDGRSVRVLAVRPDEGMPEPWS